MMTVDFGTPLYVQGGGVFASLFNTVEWYNNIFEKPYKVTTISPFGFYSPTDRESSSSGFNMLLSTVFRVVTCALSLLTLPALAIVAKLILRSLFVEEGGGLPYTIRRTPWEDPFFIHREAPQQQPVFIHREAPQQRPVFIHREAPQQRPVFIHREAPQQRSTFFQTPALQRQRPTVIQTPVANLGGRQRGGPPVVPQQRPTVIQTPPTRASNLGGRQRGGPPVVAQQRPTVIQTPPTRASNLGGRQRGGPPVAPQQRPTVIQTPPTRASNLGGRQRGGPPAGQRDEVPR